MSDGRGVRWLRLSRMKIPTLPPRFVSNTPLFPSSATDPRAARVAEQLSLCKIPSAVDGSDLRWRRREPLFEEGCKAGPCVKFRTQIRGSGSGRLLL